MNIPVTYTTLQEVHSWLNKDLVLGFDTETDGKYGKICLAQFYQEGWPSVLFVRFPDAIMLAAMLNSQPIAMHNSHYDVTCIQIGSGTRWVPTNYIDTFFASRLYYYKEDGFSLDEVYTYALGFDPYKKAGLVKAIMQKTSYAEHITKDQEQYAAIDVYYMPTLVACMQSIYDQPAYRLDIAANNYFLDMQWNGLPVDSNRLYELYQQKSEQAAELCKDFNVNSYIQVRQRLGTNKSDDDTLVRLAVAGNKMAKDIREKKKLLKRISFMDKWLSERIYGKFKVSARSGRGTCEDQNLQQLPRDLKACFGVSEDRVLIYADYAQLELRTICAITVCLRMEQLFRAGEDLHSYTRDFIFGTAEQELARLLGGRLDLPPEAIAEAKALAQETADNNRQVSKTCNFNFLYAGGIPVFLGILLANTGIVMAEAKANDIRKQWRRLWRELFQWQQKGIQDFGSGRPGSTPLGRRYTAMRVTDHLNIENQGSGADVSKLACHYMAPKLKALNLAKDSDVMVCNFIHDSWILEAPNTPEIYEEAAKVLAHSMQQAWFEISKVFRIKDLPMPVVVKVGHNWGDIEKGKNVIYTYNLEGLEEYANV